MLSCFFFLFLSNIIKSNLNLHEKTLLKKLLICIKIIVFFLSFIKISLFIWVNEVNNYVKLMKCALTFRFI